MRTKARRLERLSRRLSKIASREGCSKRYNRALTKWARLRRELDREVVRG